MVRDISKLGNKWVAKLECKYLCQPHLRAHWTIKAGNLCGALRNPMRGDKLHLQNNSHIQITPCHWISVVTFDLGILSTIGQEQHFSRDGTRGRMYHCLCQEGQIVHAVNSQLLLLTTVRGTWSTYDRVKSSSECCSGKGAPAWSLSQFLLILSFLLSMYLCIYLYHLLSIYHPYHCVCIYNLAFHHL